MESPSRQAIATAVLCLALGADVFGIPQFTLHEISVPAGGDYQNPYVDLEAEVVLTEPGGVRTRNLPLFWDGGKVWKFRVAADKAGAWSWRVSSRDKEQNGKAGRFQVEASDHKGSIRPMNGYPHHFEREDESRFWFLGDTAWALYMDSADEKLDRAAALRYIDTRVAEGFNVVHSALLSEAGWGNVGGPPFQDIGHETINPAYWQEVDQRLAYATGKGLVCGLAIAWGDKRKREPYAWRRFPSVEARKRYARYVAARYSAYNVYFILAGEWHGEIHTRGNVTEAEIRREFIEIGDALHAADAHNRMKAIHPMTSHGSAREFNDAKWMSFGDYQQNYNDLHARILESRRYNKPIVNSEYGYFLRDQSGDGVPDKDNSTSIESMRHASWDIVMAGGYVVTGFGTTYFGGNRDPGPFDVDAKKNKPFAEQMRHMKNVFTSLEWWKLKPNDDALVCSTPRGKDGRQLGQAAPPQITYWCLSESGRQYVLYARGLKEPVTMPVQPTAFEGTEWNPRSGESKVISVALNGDKFEYQPPDQQDWVVAITRKR